MSRREEAAEEKAERTCREAEELRGTCTCESSNGTSGMGKRTVRVYALADHSVGQLSVARLHRRVKGLRAKRIFCVI